MTDELTFPIREAFRRLRVSPPTGYQLIQDGVLDSYKIGRRRYATAEQVRQCLDRLAERENKEARG